MGEKPKVSEQKPKEYILDLTKIDTEVESLWWNQVYGDNFGFRKSIPMIHHCKTRDGDVLIHKKRNDGDKYPLIRYFYVNDGEASLMSNDDIKKYMGNSLIEYVKKNKCLPFACEVADFFKNGNVKINYSPTEWDNFAINISVKKGLRYGIDDVHAFFKELKADDKNPAFAKTASTGHII